MALVNSLVQQLRGCLLQCCV